MMMIFNLKQKSFEKKYPGFISNKLSKNQRFNLSKEELGYSSIKQPEEIYKILGWNSYFKIIIAKLLSFYFMFRIV